MHWKPERLRAVLEEQGRTRKWLALQCGLSPKAIHRYFTREAPCLPVAKLIARVLEVPESELFGADTLVHDDAESQSGAVNG